MQTGEEVSSGNVSSGLLSHEFANRRIQKDARDATCSLEAATFSK